MPTPERVSSEFRTTIPRIVREHSPFLPRRTRISTLRGQETIPTASASKIERSSRRNNAATTTQPKTEQDTATPIERKRFELVNEYYRLLFPKKEHLHPREYPEATKRFFSHILHPESPAFSKKYSAWYWGYVCVRTGLFLVPLLPFVPAALGIGWQVIIPLFLSTFLAPGAFTMLKTYALASREMYIKPLTEKVRNLRAVRKEYRQIAKDEKFKDIPPAKKKNLAREVVYAREFSTDFKDEIEKQQQALKKNIPSVSDEIAQTIAFKSVLTSALYRSLSTMANREREQLAKKFPDTSQQFQVYHYLRRQAEKARENEIADSIIMQGSSIIKTALIGRTLTTATSFKLLTFLLFYTSNLSIAAAGTSVAFSAVWRFWSRSMAAFQQGKNEVLKKRTK